MYNRKYILILSMIFLFAILPIVSAEATNSTYVAGTGEAIVYGGLNLILLVFLAGCFLVFLKFDNLLTRVGSFGMGYLLLIALSFVAWQMANDFVTSTFLIAMFRIIYLVLVIGFFPLLIAGFAIYVILIFKIKEIERLMSKGMDYDEAERRIGGKR